MITPLRQITRGYATRTDFPETGNPDFLYRARDTGIVYRVVDGGYVEFGGDGEQPGDGGLPDYSTDEHLTGAAWIDGKPVYRMVIQETIWIQGYASYPPETHSFEITNYMDTLISVRGTMQPHDWPGFGSTFVVIPGVISYGNPSGSADAHINVREYSGSGITLAISGSYPAGYVDVTLIVEYTKTEE